MLDTIQKLAAATTGDDLFKDFVASGSLPTTLGLAWLANLTTAQVTLLLGLLNFIAVVVFRLIELRRRTKQEETIKRLQERLDHYEQVL